MLIEVGARAPEFMLKDQNNQEVALADFAGRKAVLLVFYPFAFSGVCTSELREIRDDLDDSSAEAQQKEKDFPLQGKEIKTS